MFSTANGTAASAGAAAAGAGGNGAVVSMTDDIKPPSNGPADRDLFSSFTANEDLWETDTISDAKKLYHIASFQLNNYIVHWELDPEDRSGYASVAYLINPDNDELQTQTSLFTVASVIRSAYRIASDNEGQVDVSQSAHETAVVDNKTSQVVTKSTAPSPFRFRLRGGNDLQHSYIAGIKLCGVAPANLIHPTTSPKVSWSHSSDAKSPSAVSAQKREVERAMAALQDAFSVALEQIPMEGLGIKARVKGHGI